MRSVYSTEDAWRSASAIGLQRLHVRAEIAGVKSKQNHPRAGKGPSQDMGIEGRVLIQAQFQGEPGADRCFDAGASRRTLLLARAGSTRTMFPPESINPRAISPFAGIGPGVWKISQWSGQKSQDWLPRAVAPAWAGAGVYLQPTVLSPKSVLQPDAGGEALLPSSDQRVKPLMLRQCGW